MTNYYTVLFMRIYNKVLTDTLHFEINFRKNVHFPFECVDVLATLTYINTNYKEGCGFIIFYKNVTHF